MNSVRVFILEVAFIRLFFQVDQQLSSGAGALFEEKWTFGLNKSLFQIGFLAHACALRSAVPLPRLFRHIQLPVASTWVRADI